MNHKFNKSQILMFSLLVLLLIITPLLSSSLRPTYLYFVINILIIALGAEAGLLSAFSKPPEDKKYSAKPVKVTQLGQEHISTDTELHRVSASPDSSRELKKVKAAASEKINCGAVKVDKVKKCPSTPSLFFIGSTYEAADDQAFGEELDEDEEAVSGLSGQELFTKAEMFIGNFYRQLKMQKEDSWKRIHGFYQKAF